MKAAPIAHTLNAYGRIIQIRSYSDARFGFDHLERGVRVQVRRKHLPAAIRYAEEFAKPIPLMSKDPQDRKELRRRLRLLAYAAKKRARKHGREFSITAKDLQALGEKQNWRCAVTGIRLRFQKEKKWHKSPFSPSVDRIENSGGYTIENVRVVATCVNSAMNEWGVEVFDAMCREYINNHL